MTALSWVGFELCQGRDTVWAHLPHCRFVIWGCSDIVAERRAHCDHAAALHRDRSELGWTLSDAKDVTQYGPTCRTVLLSVGDCSGYIVAERRAHCDHAAALHQDRSELGWTLSYARDVTQYGPNCRTVVLSFGAVVTLLQSAAHIAITRQPCTTTAPSWVGL